MKKNLLLTTLLMLVGSIQSMEEREKSHVTPINAKIKTYLDLDKLPYELKDIINKFRIFEFEQLPDELIMAILQQLTVATSLDASINAINNLRLVDRRINNIINSLPFVDQIINYWSKKFNLNPIMVALKWPISGVITWLKANKDLLNKNNILNLHLVKPVTPLINAVLDHNLEEVKILIEAGADVNQKRSDSDTRTALHFALYEGDNDYAMLKFLVKSGANINQEDDLGETVLFQAIDDTRQKLIKYLISIGIDLNKENNEGLTPLKFAQNLQNQYGYFQPIVDLLKEHGAK